MKNFWPQRQNVKGFSIENLARKYREKISGVSSTKILDKNNLKSMNLDRYINGKVKSHLQKKGCHWANRDFSEYREVA